MLDEENEDNIDSFFKDDEEFISLQGKLIQLEKEVKSDKNLKQWLVIFEESIYIYTYNAWWYVEVYSIIIFNLNYKDEHWFFERNQGFINQAIISIQGLLLVHRPICRGLVQKLDRLVWYE